MPAVILTTASSWRRSSRPSSSSRGKPAAKGERYFLVRLANRDGGREVWACTLKEATDYPSPGDLVGFRVVRYDPELAAGLELLGYIAFGFDPVYAPGKGWRIACNYTPANIRQTVRW